jgi:hypothetical protein
MAGRDWVHHVAVGLALAGAGVAPRGVGSHRPASDPSGEVGCYRGETSVAPDSLARWAANSRRAGPTCWDAEPCAKPGMIPQARATQADRGHPAPWKRAIERAAKARHTRRTPRCCEGCERRNVDSSWDSSSSLDAPAHASAPGEQRWTARVPWVALVNYTRLPSKGIVRVPWRNRAGCQRPGEVRSMGSGTYPACLPVTMPTGSWRCACNPFQMRTM